MSSIPDIQTPAARNSDPETSHLAAEEITKSGKRKAQQQKVLNAVKKFPNRTSAEIANRSKLDRYAVARRLPELATAGLVKRGNARQCRINHRQAIVWSPV